MNDATSLGVMAAALTVMALLQVGAVIGAALVARRIQALLARLERDVQPALERLTVMSGDAARTARLVASQAERLDQTVSSLGTRVDDALSGVHRAIAKPTREGAALMVGIRTAVSTLASLRRRREPRSSDDGELFIG